MQYQTESQSTPASYSNFPAAKHGLNSSSVKEIIIQIMVSENAVVIFSTSTCCMCHAVKRLFCGMGGNPTVYELDELDPELNKALMRLQLGAVPVVFVGGKLVGSLERVMASHINGTLVPLLKEAGALWL